MLSGKVTVDWSSESALKTADNSALTVVLVSPRNTLNIGAVARAMSNFGASDLRVANIYYKEFRSASSAVGPAAELLRNARDFATLAEAIEDCTLVVGTTGAVGRTWALPYERLEQSAIRMRGAMEQGRVALLFGSEKFGLSNDDMSHCHALLRIPTRDEHASMNLGQAAAVCLYELSRLDAAASAENGEARELPRLASGQVSAPAGLGETRGTRLPTAGDFERLTVLFEETLLASGYPAMHSRHRARQLRILARRLGMPADDASHWMGFLRQILWKLRSSSS
jgi:tRNA/rRNA methyltransferase